MKQAGWDRFAGCLLGGAVGDALGAPIEFYNIAQIRRQYGPDGLDHYVEGTGDSGIFTDDTQMTLFTAEGILRAHNRASLRGISGAQNAILYQSYLRWLYTQGIRPQSMPQGMGIYDVENGWMMKQHGLFKLRAPGNTCLGALASGKYGTPNEPINNSKGCGGIMRAAPVGLFYNHDARLAFEYGCESAALTHGHPSGYLSAGFLACVIACLLSGEELPSAIDASIHILCTWKNHQECLKAVEQAQQMYAQKTGPSPENIETLGGGWVGEETLAISLFCALHFEHDFRGGVLAAINHSGDCDSTGAVTGNILGAMLGRQAIAKEWLNKLEMADVVEEMAGDLFLRIDHQDEDGWSKKYPPY